MDKNKLYIDKLISIFDDAFNSNIGFASMDSDEFLEFVDEFMNGKTEYYKDDYFLNNYDSIVLKLLKKIK
tara:strand:- start:1064 stop:1273 length:210 start_codon:yes stop_codon:yes gene_type:complete